MLLNKIPVLDNGYVALISSATPDPIYKDVVDEYFGGKANPALRRACFSTMVFKAPLFVQLHLAQSGLSLISTTTPTETQAYNPNAGEIGTKEHDLNRVIADDIARTTSALLINPTAYQSDGADRFISQIIMPISTYATFIVSGTLDQWQKFYQVKTIAAPIKAYTLAVEQIIKAEWKNV